ncbi:HAMP domain-containing sensor histidine kinase [Gorillibacterium sp. CAU 1737]|uniref:sensor histidine kinase n=1 Tax=Gorillibacterium sp. CAU 1737 TaxID=3140362 RepID=UPI0032604F04
MNHHRKQGGNGDAEPGISRRLTRIPGDLWGMLVLFVFGIMLSAGIIMAILAFIVIQFHLVRTGHPNFLLVIAIMTMTSVLLGTIITGLTGRKVLAPLTQLSDAAKEVAKGNFNVRLDYETHKVRELGEMAHNFNKMVQELNGIETLRNDFVANVSHEFKTPIAAIEGYSALLQDPELPMEEREEYSRLIMESTKQLSSLSSNILKLSKLETQEITLNASEFPLDEQIRHALLFLEPLWNEKELNLELQLDPVRYIGDEELLMQVWMNLLGNAIKFTERGGEIGVTLRSAEDGVTVSVSDTGVGMSEEVQRRAFERFYQGDRSRAREGNGLGLPLVKRIVELCGGEVRVESEPGAGAVFTVRLPERVW